MADELEAVPADLIWLTIVGPFSKGLNSGETNLVSRAECVIPGALARCGGNAAGDAADQDLAGCGRYWRRFR
ncbi:MAG: hypothetical protein U5N53_09520 [Mycobacterium sp.]|nr:hypothetical protein [Mycobacterium sp.]